MGRWVEFAMTNPASRTQVLEVTRLNDRSISHAVLVFQSSAHYVGENLRVVVRVCGEPPARLNDVIVHHDERMKAIVVFVVIIGEGKSEPGVKPSMFGYASLTT